MQFTDTNCRAIAIALRIAAKQYDRDREALLDLGSRIHSSLYVTGFSTEGLAADRARQRDHALALATEIEEEIG